MNSPSPPPPGWRRLLHGNVLWLAAASFLNDASSEMIFPLLPLFLVGTLGAGPAFLGLIEGAAETTASFAKLGGGWLSDRLGKRKGLVAWGYAVAAASRPLMAAAALPWHVLAIRLGDRVGKGLRTAPRDALLAESVGPGQRGRAFGVHRAADHAGAVLGPLLATGVLLAFPGRLRLVFLLAVLPAAAAVMVVGSGVREHAPAPERAEGTAPADHAPVAPGEDAVEPAAGSYRAFLAVLVLFTLGNASDAFLLLRAADLGVATALVPLLWTVLHVSKMACNVAGGIAVDRWGGRRSLIAGWAVYAAVYGGFALATEAWHAWLLFAVYGLFHGLTEPAERVLVAALGGARRRARAFGGYHFALGIAALPASLLFGVVWELFGAPTAFGVGAALALVALAALPMTVAAPPRRRASRRVRP